MEALNAQSLTRSVLRVFPPVRRVYLCRPCDHQLQLSGVEDGHQTRVDDLRDTKHEHVPFDTCFKTEQEASEYPS